MRYIKQNVWVVFLICINFISCGIPVFTGFVNELEKTTPTLNTFEVKVKGDDLADGDTSGVEVYYKWYDINSYATDYKQNFKDFNISVGANPDEYLRKSAFFRILQASDVATLPVNYEVPLIPFTEAQGKSGVSFRLFFSFIGNATTDANTPEVQETNLLLYREPIVSQNSQLLRFTVLNVANEKDIQDAKITIQPLPSSLGLCLIGFVTKRVEFDIFYSVPVQLGCIEVSPRII